MCPEPLPPETPPAPSSGARFAPPSREVMAEYERLLQERRAAAKRGEDTRAMEAHLIAFMRAHGLVESHSVCCEGPVGCE